MIYFDHNATTPLHPAAKTAWLEAAEANFGNPSSPHRVGGRADAALTAARQELAARLGCSPLDIVWTSGASEAAATVLHHAARKASPGAEVWISAIEHPCVLQAARQLFHDRTRLIPVGLAGSVRLDWLADGLARSRPALVAIMAANNETGVLQPWPEALELCRQQGVPFFCDAVQWIGKLPARGLGACDFVSGSAHKFGGPKGVGFLKCPKGPLLEPLIHGGPQEDGRRAGTENVAGVLSMMAALRVREEALAAGEEHLRETWRTSFERELTRRFPNAVVVGKAQPRLWNTVSAMLPEGSNRRRWVVKLDKLGFAVSTGSACASGKEAPSHVLSAMGCSAAEASRVLRFSAGWETTEADWERLLEGLQRAQSEMV